MLRLKSTEQEIFSLTTPANWTKEFKECYMLVLIPHALSKRGYRGQATVVNKTATYVPQPTE